MAETTELETTEQERKTTGNGGGNNGHQPQTQVVTDPDKLFRSGIAKERKKVTADLTSELADYGVKPVVDGKGRIDIKASLAALAKAGQPEAAAVIEQRYAGTIANLRNENESLKSEVQKTRVTAVVREKIASHGPQNLDDAVDLFMLRYIIKPDDETNQLMVCDNAGNPMHDAGTLLPLTVEMACQKFANERPGLFGKTTGNGLQGLGSMKGSPSVSRNEDLQEQYRDALDNGDKDKAARLLNEIQGRVKRQYSK